MEVKEKWPRRLVIVRHGESEQNVAIDLFEKNLPATLEKLKNKKDPDIVLTNKGISQAKKTGAYLSKTEKFDICFCSPYKRSLQTAKAIISKLKYRLKIYEDVRLREKEFGRLHGLSVKDIKRDYPEEYEDRNRDGVYWYRILRGENYPDVQMRIYSFLEKISRDWGGKNVLIVTHHVPYVLFNAIFNHLGEKEVIKLGGVPNCGIQEFNSDFSKSKEGRLKLKYYNKKTY